MSGPVLSAIDAAIAQGKRTGFDNHFPVPIVSALRLLAEAVDNGGKLPAATVAPAVPVAAPAVPSPAAAAPATAPAAAAPAADPAPAPAAAAPAAAVDPAPAAPAAPALPAADQTLAEQLAKLSPEERAQVEAAAEKPAS